MKQTVAQYAEQLRTLVEDAKRDGVGMVTCGDTCCERCITLFAEGQHDQEVVI